MLTVLHLNTKELMVLIRLAVMVMELSRGMSVRLMAATYVSSIASKWLFAQLNREVRINFVAFLHMLVLDFAEFVEKIVNCHY